MKECEQFGYIVMLCARIGIKQGSGITELRRRKKGQNAEKGIKRGKGDKTPKKG